MHTCSHRSTDAQKQHLPSSAQARALPTLEHNHSRIASAQSDATLTHLVAFRLLGRREAMEPRHAVPLLAAHQRRVTTHRHSTNTPTLHVRTEQSALPTTILTILRPCIPQCHHTTTMPSHLPSRPHPV
eukprot:589042-Rhodomonas_salina.1